MDRRLLGATLQRLKGDLLELVFPTRCAGCGVDGAVWCPDCQLRLVRVAGEICLWCRRTLTPETRHGCPPPAARARAAAHYRTPLDRALTHLKYRPDDRLESAMADLLLKAYRETSLQASCVVPVPLGARRLRQRGYNQVERLGRKLAGRLRLPLVPEALMRTRETASQVGLDPQERWANVAGAFRAEPSLVREQTVLLVDDVHTTGATLAACASALSEAGVEAVLALTIGRT